jgi:RNA polymerase sigma factor for flagellar operon FliA
LTSPHKPLSWTERVRSDERHRAEFLESHVDLVRYLALRMSSRLPASVELDDLVHDGILGLLDAVEKFDAARGVRFRTYAESRVRGAILDGLRQKDWRPRSVRLLRRNLDAVVGELAASRQRAATEEEIADAMGLDVDTYRSVLRDASVGPLLSLDDVPSGVAPAADPGERPDLRLDRSDLIHALAEEITALPERERRVIELYYKEELNMKEVGAVLGITESRVCQLHGQAASRLRAALQARLHATPDETTTTVPSGR